MTLADIHNNLAYELQINGDHDSAIHNYQVAIGHYEKIPGRSDKICNSKCCIANIYRSIGKSSEARVIFQSALDEMRSTNLDDDRNLEVLAITTGDFGNFEGQMGHQQRAFELKKESLDLNKKLAERNPDDEWYLSRVGTGYNNVAVSQYRQNNVSIAIEYLKQAIAVQEKLVFKSPSRTQYQLVLARSLGNLGAMQKDVPAKKEAIGSFMRCVAILEKLRGRRSQTSFVPALPRFLFQWSRSSPSGFGATESRPD